jgi:hypothetical protein
VVLGLGQDGAQALLDVVLANMLPIRPKEQMTSSETRSNAGPLSPTGFPNRRQQRHWSCWTWA